MNDWLGVIGLKYTAFIGGLAGALVSLKFVPGATLWQRGLNVAGGMLAAGFLAPLAQSAFTLKDSVAAGVGFLIGMYGMTVADAVYAQIPVWIAIVRKKYVGKEGDL